MGKVLTSLLVMLLAIMFLAGGNVMLVADGGADLAPKTEDPIFTVDGGADLAPDAEKNPVLADGGADLIPEIEEPTLVADDGGDDDYAPESMEITANV